MNNNWDHIKLKDDEKLRMWMVSPKMLCNMHLLGEHREMHAIAGMLLKETSIQGYIDNNLIEIQSVVKRHNALAKEMTVRGYKHRSPMSENQMTYEYLTEEQFNYQVNKKSSFNDLYNRCQMCAWRSYIYYYHDYNLLDPYYVDTSILFSNSNGIYGLTDVHVFL